MCSWTGLAQVQPGPSPIWAGLIELLFKLSGQAWAYRTCKSKAVCGYPLARPMNTLINQEIYTNEII